jgi:hypothetical protein
MSEMDAAPVESAPQSTTEIAASVVESAEQEAASTPEGSPRLETQTLEPETPAETKAAKSDASKAAEFLRKMGHQLVRSDGRKAFMPLPTVAKMLDDYVAEHTDGWTTEKTTYEQKVQQYEAERAEMYRDIQGDPRALLEKLAQFNPGLQTFLTPQQATQLAQTAQAMSDQMPQPDLPLADGSRTYSLEGIQKLLDWKTAQVEARLDSKLKPFTEREQQAAQREKAQQAQAQAREKAQSQMTEAQTWPLFGPIASDGKLSEFQNEVMQAYLADKSLDLRGAYMKVALPRLTEDDNAKRARLLKEQATAPKAPALSRSGGESMRKAGPRTTVEIAREAIAKLEAGA